MDKLQMTTPLVEMDGDEMTRVLGRFHGIGANCIAALLGTVTPFCSCSSIPLFMGFTSAGLPLGVTFSLHCMSTVIVGWSFGQQVSIPKSLF